MKCRPEKTYRDERIQVARVGRLERVDDPGSDHPSFEVLGIWVWYG